MASDPESPSPWDNTSDGPAFDADTVRHLLGDHAQPPLIARLCGFREKYKLDRVARELRHAQTSLKSRPMTTDEIRTIAEQSSRMVDAMSLNRPLALSLALLFTIRGRATLRFPFWQPKFVKTSPHAFPTRAIPLLKDDAATAAWHLARFFCYAAVCRFAVMSFINPVALTSRMQAMTASPITRQYLEDLRPPGEKNAVTNTMQGSRSLEWRNRHAQDTRAASQESAEQNAGDAWRGAPLLAERSKSAKKQNKGHDGHQASEKSIDGRDGDWQAPSGSTPESYPPSTNPSSSRSGDDSDPFEDDDMSPVAPSHRSTKPDSGRGSQTGRSSWEELRSRARSAQGQSPRVRARVDSGERAGSPAASNQDYTYSTEEAERTTAKAQAQAEFDAMLEAERRGESNSNTNGRRG